MAGNLGEEYGRQSRNTGRWKLALMLGLMEQFISKTQIWITLWIIILWENLKNKL